MPPDPSRRPLPPPSAGRCLPSVPPGHARSLTARELQLASDVELARGNHRRGELLSWRAHDARATVSA